MRLTLVLAAAPVALSVLAAPAIANPVIFDNGAPRTDAAADYLSDFDANYQFADDFSLGVASHLTGFNWWGVYFPARTPGTDNFTIEIYADAGGSPALAPLFTFGLGAIPRVDTGVDQADGDNIYAYSAGIASTALGAGTYWLSIFNNTTLDVDDNWYWSRSNLAGNDRYRNGFAGSWSDLPGEQAFQIEGSPVPEPATLLLLGGGLAGLAVRRRRLTH